MAENPAEHQVPLKLVVNKMKYKILYAEAGKQFVDVLLSFFTLPLGTIVRIVGKESKKLKPIGFGCLSSLYESVANLDEQRLWTQACKQMLLKPKNYAMENYCQNLKLNIDDTEPTKYYECDKPLKGEIVSTFPNLRCSCGGLFAGEIFPINDSDVNYDGFVRDSTFIVCDDLCVLPRRGFGKTLVMLRHLGVEDADSIEEFTVTVTKEKVLDLFKLALLSKTPLTDLFLKKKQFFKNFNSTSQNQFNIGDLKGFYKSEGVALKAVLRKSNQKVLFYEADKDFVDMLFMFLTLPLGGVMNLLQGSSSLYCIDTLYQSVAEMSPDKCFKSQELRDGLVKPGCPPRAIPTIPVFLSGDLSGDSPCRYAFCSKGDYGGYYVDPTSTTGEILYSDRGGTLSDRGFVKVQSTKYMVTDDLVVTPMSSISAISILKRFRVPFCDIQEKNIQISPQECLGILKASLVSSLALSNVLKEL